MLVFIIIVMVLIGIGYADYCLIDNTAHFGICYGKLAEAETETRAAGPMLEADAVDAPDAVENAVDRPLPDPAASASEPESEASYRPLRAPVPAWLLQDLEPVLEVKRTPRVTTAAG